jgi:hypothetical protein
MAKRKQADAKRMQDASGGYQVGYGRPPQHTRFKRGQSGNPRGRRPGQPNMKTAIQRVLTAKEIDALLRSHLEQQERQRCVRCPGAQLWRQGRNVDGS